MSCNNAIIPRFLLVYVLWYQILQTCYSPERCAITALAFVMQVGSRTAHTNKSKFTPVSNSFDDNEAQKLEQSWILLAESQQSMRNKIGKYLANEGGYTVTGVSDAKSVLLICHGMVQPKNIPNMINSTKPDCIVVDAYLPDPINGLDLLKMIRSDPVLNLLPVILLGERGRSDGLDAGADAYLSKPFNLEELLSVIDGTLKRSSPSSRLTESSNDKLSMLKADELWKEISDIKSLLVNAGFNMTDSCNSTSNNGVRGSIHEGISEIKQSLMEAKEDSGEIFILHSEFTVTLIMDSISNYSSEAVSVANQDTHHDILLPGKQEYFDSTVH